MIIPFPASPKTPKETARALKEGHQAADQNKQADRSADELDSAMGECRLLALLQPRLAQFGLHLYPLSGDKLLLSHEDGTWSTAPDLYAARQILKRLEASHG